MAQLTTGYIVQVLTAVLNRFGDRLHDQEKDAIEEAARLVRQHERLVALVLPDLRRRLTEAEGKWCGDA